MPSYFTMIELKTSLDWPKVHSELKSLAKMLPEFSNDFFKCIKRIENLVVELSNIEVEQRQKLSEYKKIRHKDKVAQINFEIKTIKKIHLMSVMSR